MTSQQQADLENLGLTEEQLKKKTEEMESLSQESNGRKPRSDKGKPRDTFYVSIPGIRFDLAEEVGREAFKRWFGAAILEQGNMLVYCLKALDELFAHLDRLRK